MQSTIPQLRKYQSDMREKIRRYMRAGIKDILVTAPCGSGKTILVAHMLKTANSKGMRANFIVHRRELIKQSIQAFKDVGVPHGIIARGWEPDYKKRIQIASIQTLTRRYEKYSEPSLNIWDEAHHCAAGSWRRIYEAYPNAYNIGLTATPLRLDGMGLGKWFSAMVNGPSVQWLIANGYLASYKLYAPSKLNLSKVHTRMGDYVQSEISALVDKPTITGDVIKHYKKLCNGKRAVVFCVSVKHSLHVVEQFNQAGISAAHIDGETKMEERDEKLNQFRNGSIKVLSNVDLFGEGFDLPSLEVAILLRPTKSLGLYLQQVGRSLRTYENKSFAIILDHAGNCEQHGLPCENREWTLAGNKGNKEGSKNEISVKICPKCYAAQKPGELYCIYCNHQFEDNSRVVNEVEGELVEVDHEALRKIRKRQQGGAQSLEELTELGRKRGYKRPRLWAKYIFNAREAKRRAGL